MKKLSFFAALVVAMSAVSCVKDINGDTPATNDTPAVNDGAVIFEASFGAISKAVLEPGSEESKVAWEAGDQVSVLADEGNYLYTAASAGYSTTLSTEDPDVPSDVEFYAVYPYVEDAELEGDVITTTLPAEQYAVPGSFSTHLAVAKASGNQFAFKNVCGLVKITVSSDDVTKVEFKGNDNEVVAGRVAVTVSEEPSWAKVADGGATAVTIVPAEGTTVFAKGVYYFSVLPQEFAKGITVTAYKGTEAWDVRKVSSSVTIARCGIIGSNSFGVEGTGTEADPYILDCAQDLVEMRNLAPVDGETWFKMTKNIDLKGINWVPVNYDQDFKRMIHFDGNGKTISNLSCNSNSYSGYPSFFGVLYGSCKNLTFDNATITGTGASGVIGGYVGTTDKPALVENVTITKSTVTSSGDRAGGVAGDAKEATFRNVSFQGTVKSTKVDDNDGTCSGGFVGKAEKSAVFENCAVKATEEGVVSTVKGKARKLGGFVGMITGDKVTFSNCSANASVEGEGHYTGGFAGHLANTATITNCSATGNVTSKGSSCAGFLGCAASNVELTGCYASGNVTANNNVGGVIGNVEKGITVTLNGCYYNGTQIKANQSVGGVVGNVNTGAYVNLNICYSSGNIAADSSNMAGIIGNASGEITMTDCYAEGVLSSSQNYVGGLIGYLPANATITGCHFSGTVTGRASVAGLVSAVETGATLTLKKSYVQGEVTPSGTKGGGLIGGVSGTADVENCWADVTLNMPNNQFGGGVVGGASGAITIKNCFMTGLINVGRGCGCIAGRLEGTNPTVEGCIAWGEIKTNRSEGQYSPGAIVGNIKLEGTFKDCWRKADMSFTDVIMKLVDHENVEKGFPAFPDYNKTDQNQCAYHGKAAAADATISSVAKTIGWDETIWDLSGDVPALK